MRLDFLVCADHRFVMPCGVTLESLCANDINNDLNIHLISDSTLYDSDIDDLTAIVKKYNPGNNLFVYKVNDETLIAWPWYKDGYYPKQIFYRLLCSALLPSNVDTVFYIDCDTIIREPLDLLWKIDMSNHPIAASPDASESGKRLGFNDDDVYFNSGVLLINLKYWREHDCQSQLFEFIDNHKNEFPLPDQDPLNIIFKDSKLHLDLRYNLQPIALYKDYYVSFPWHKYEDEFRRAQVNPAIIHYAGVRPWEKRCKHPYKEEWFKYRAMTKWTNMPLAPSRITATTRLKNFIRMLLTPFGVCHYVRDYYNRNMHLES